MDMENKAITHEQRLVNFCNIFDRGKDVLFGNLDESGKADLKNQLSISLTNFSKRVGWVNAGTGANTAKDIFEAIAEPIESQLKVNGVNFSNDLGGVKSQNISTLILQAQYQSYGLSYIFDTYGMDHPTCLYNYQLLAAKNDFGVYEADDVVLDPRSTPHPSAFMTGRSISTLIKEVGASTFATVEFSKPLRMNTVVVKGVKSGGEEEFIGSDKPISYKEGVIPTVHGDVGKLTVNYRTGQVKTEGASASSTYEKFIVEAMYDYTKDSDMSTHQPMFYSRQEHVELNALPSSWSLEQNIEDIVHMNKLNYVNKPAGLISDYAKNTINSLMSLYARDIDKNIMDAMVLPYINYIKSLRSGGVFDLTGWDNFGNQNVYEGKIAHMFASVELTMQNRADGRAPTAIIVDTKGASALMTSRLFVKQGSALGYSDGYIGTYNGVPIVRSRYLDWYFSPLYHGSGKGQNKYNVSETIKSNIGASSSGESFSVMFAVHKDSTNKVSAGVFGNFIPPYATSSMPKNNGEIIVHTINTEYAVKLLLPNLVVPFIAKLDNTAEIGLPNIPVV